MISFHLFNSRTFFSGDPEEVEKVRECLRVKNSNAHWQALQIAKKSCGGDRTALITTTAQIEAKLQWLKFYDRNSFCSGLSPLVRKKLQEKGIETEWKFQNQEDLEYKLSRDTFHIPDLRGMELREEQVEAVFLALRKRRGILHMATNAGKTLLSAAIVLWLRENATRIPNVLFLVHRSGLAEQTAKVFREQLRVNVGLLGAGSKTYETVTIATTQTAIRLLGKSRFQKFLQEQDVLFVDELHVNKAGMIQTLSDHCEASIRIGLSGTVSRRPEKLYPLMGMTGPIIHEIRNKELVEKGRSAKPLMRIVRIHEKDAGRFSRGNYAEIYTAAIVDCEFRNQKVIEEVLRYLARGLRTLVTIQRLEHGRILQELLAQAQVEATFLWGDISLQDRTEAKRKFSAKETSVLIVSSIFDVGEDLPEIEAWVNAAGGKGWELVLQRLGRVLRAKEGDNIVYVSDFVDLHNPVLLKHSRARLGYYLAEKIAEIEVV